MNQKVQLLLDNGLLTIEDLLEYAQQYMDGIDQYDDEQINKHTANQVFAVWCDNGLSYEDHDVSISKVFASFDDAKAYADEKNASSSKEYTPSITREEYYAQKAEYIFMSYNDWVEHEKFTFEYYNQGKYLITDEDVH